MKTTFTILASILLCFNLCAAKSIAESKVPAEPKKTQVVIIGTLHSAHHKNPKYSPDILKEIILSLKPDTILVELPLSLIDPNGRPLKGIRSRDNNCPENWAVDRVATELGVKLVPFDRPDREEYRDKTNYYERKKQSGKLKDKWLEHFEKDNPESLEVKIASLQYYAWQAQEHLYLNAGPELINSEGLDSIVRLKDSVWEDILPVIMGKDSRYKHTVDEQHFLINEWQERNAIMADNIAKAAKQNPGKRLVVVTGATHRYILRDLLKDKPSIELKEYWEVTKPSLQKTKESEEPYQPAYLKPIPPEKLKEDLDFLFKTIEEVHPNMYAYTSKEEFDPLREQLYKSLNRPMNRFEFYKLIAPVVTKLKSGHTYVSGLWEDFRSYCKTGGKVFPIELDWDGERAFLVANYGVSALPIGGTLVAINGKDTDKVIRMWARYSANERSNSDPWLIKRRSVLWEYLWLEYGDAESLTLRIKSIDGKVADYVVRAISAEQAKKSVKTIKGPWTRFLYRYIPEYNVGVIKVNQFDATPAFREFLDKTFEEIHNKRASNLIIDIRENPGGSSIPGDWLLKYLTDKPFAQFEGHLAQPGDKPFRFGGRILVLIGRLSASASVSFASAIKCSHIGTLIGEETGDTTVNYGEARPHKLPNSGLQAIIPTKYFVQACGKDDGRGVLPDYEVKQEPEDTAKGVDTVLEFALNLIKNSEAKE